MFHFKSKNIKSIQVIKPRVLALYRNSLRVIHQLEIDHQKLWYDYVRLKYKENESCLDTNRIRTLLSSGEEELQWLQSVLDRKDKKTK